MTEDRNKANAPAPEITIVECKGCGRCVISCPKDLLKLSSDVNERDYHYAEYAGEGCIGCKNCFYTCPEPNALALRLPDKNSSNKED